MVKWFKYGYSTLTIQLNISSFFYTYLKEQTALFQTIQSNICIQFKFLAVLFDS